MKLLPLRSQSADVSLISPAWCTVLMVVNPGDEITEKKEEWISFFRELHHDERKQKVNVRGPEVSAGALSVLRLRSVPRASGSTEEGKCMKELTKFYSCPVGWCVCAWERGGGWSWFQFEWVCTSLQARRTMLKCYSQILCGGSVENVRFWLVCIDHWWQTDKKQEILKHRVARSCL